MAVLTAAMRKKKTRSLPLRRLPSAKVIHQTEIEMAFRRSKTEARTRRAWTTFVQENVSLLAGIGLPGHLYESKHSFDLFIMHGWSPESEHGPSFEIEDMSDDEKNYLHQLVEKYFDAGFEDPGVIRAIHPGPRNV